MSEDLAVLMDTSTALQGSYSEMLAQAERAMQWLIEKGVRVDATRAQKLLKDVNRLNIDLSAGKTQTPDLVQLWNIAELDDLIQIATQLSDIKDPQFLETLRKVTSGPHVLADEKTTGGNIQARNATFELFAAARFACAGLPVVFKSDADATIATYGGDLVLECKRVAVAEGLEDNIRYAASQIKRRILRDGARAGYVCISISRLVHQVAMENPANIYADTQSFQSSARNMLAFLGQHVVARCCDLAPSVLAICLHYKLPFVDKRTAAPTIMNRFAFYSLLDKSHSPELSALQAHVHNRLWESVNGAR